MIRKLVREPLTNAMESIMKNNVYRFLGSIFTSLILGLIVAGQIPPVDPNAGKRVIVVTDDNFEVQRPTGPVSRRSITCQVWITTDGKLHCRTSKQLTSAELKYVRPTSSKTQPDGTVTSSGGGLAGRKLAVKELVLGQDTYTWDISGDYYRKAHSITLLIKAPLVSGEIVLINKKVPEKITN